MGHGEIVTLLNNNITLAGAEMWDLCLGVDEDMLSPFTQAAVAGNITALLQPMIQLKASTYST